MGKLISTHTGARWANPGPSSSGPSPSKGRGARRGRLTLAVDVAAAAGLGATRDRSGIPGRASMRKIAKAKTT